MSPVLFWEILTKYQQHHRVWNIHNKMCISVRPIWLSLQILFPFFLTSRWLGCSRQSPHFPSFCTQHSPPVHCDHSLPCKEGSEGSAPPSEQVFGTEAWEECILGHIEEATVLEMIARHQEVKLFSLQTPSSPVLSYSPKKWVAKCQRGFSIRTVGDF